MLKLLQEVDGHANFTQRRPAARSAGLLTLPLRGFGVRDRTKPSKKTLTVWIQDPPDIPAPVAIRYVAALQAADHPQVS